MLFDTLFTCQAADHVHARGAEAAAITHAVHRGGGVFYTVFLGYRLHATRIGTTSHLYTFLGFYI